MYMDVVIIVVLVLLAAVYFREVSNTIIGFGLIDIFLRILNFIGNNTTREINNIINKYFPASIESLIINNSSGVLEKILLWVYVILMAMFFYYVFRILLRRK